MKPAEKSSEKNRQKTAAGKGGEPYRSIELPDLFRIEEWQDEVVWQPFLGGADIYRLYGDGKSGPTAVLIRFRENSRVPVHLHEGYEHIFVLTGEQRDQNATRSRGAFTINPPGTVHGVSSKAGTIVLVIYEKPVVFL
jgi:anti-sigma factor ChrR (cupin superfamily)